MKQIFIFVEGPTEETFIKRTLSPHLSAFGSFIKAFNIGGTMKYQSNLRKQILRQVHDSGLSLVTTMFDYYGLPKDFPGKELSLSGSCYDCVAQLEQAMSDDINHRKFLPYLSLHEFEALLFAAPDEIARSFPEKDETHELIKIKTAHRNNPEEINDGELKAPSKQLKRLYAGYQKPLHGTEVIQRIGLEVIRRECRHFHEWLEKLENLAKQ